MQVSSIGRVYVKATRFLSADSVTVDADGIRGDRAFALLEADDKFINVNQHRGFLSLSFDHDAVNDRLVLELPDGKRIEGSAMPTGRRVAVDHHGMRKIETGEVEGPWAKVLSAFARRPIALVRCLSERRAIDVLPITLLTTGSLARMAREMGQAVDARRFRAGFVIDHAAEHAEDEWDGRRVQLGEVVLRVRGSVPRCAVTRYNPATGVRDTEVLKALLGYRRQVGLPDGLMPGYVAPGFASYAEVLHPGRVSVGDAAVLLD